MPDVRLEINGRQFTGWKEVETSQSLEAVAGLFTLQVSDLPTRFPIRAGDACQLLVGTEKVIDGFVDKVSGKIDAGNHTMTVTGRDRTMDLVDCSATNPSQEFLNISFVGLLKRLAAPFQVPVTVTVPDLAPFKKFSLQQESAFAAIERACRLRGVLAIPGPDGGLRVVPYGESRADTALVLGKNLESAELTDDHQNRFSEYIAVGQQPGDDDLEGEATTEVYATAKDSAVRRYRPYVVVIEGAASLGVAQERARWEAAVRAARSTTLAVRVTGWHQKAGGRLWRINELASCEIPGLMLLPKTELLITGVRRVLNDKDGTVTDLTLTRRDAYLKKPDQREEKPKSDGDDGGELTWIP